MTDERLERDSMGVIGVAKDAFWGAQTQRALLHFHIGQERFPRSFIRALGLAKRAAAATNMQLQRLDPRRGEAIVAAAIRMIAGELDDSGRAGSPFSADHLAKRLRNPNQHECQ